MDWLNKVTAAAKEAAAAAAAQLDQRTAGMRKVASEKAKAAAAQLEQRTAGMRKFASEKTAGVRKIVENSTPNLMVQGQKIMAQSREFAKGFTRSSVVKTAILTNENFKAELKKMKDDFLIILQKDYTVANPDIDCLLKGGYVTITSNYEFDRSVINVKGRWRPKNVWEKTWKKQITPGSFYTSLGLKSFDELQTKNEITFQTFWQTLELEPAETQLKIEINRAKLKNENTDITKVCQPPAGGASTASRSHRRSSSRKNYRKSVRSVKRAARSRSGSRTRKYRNRS